MVIWGSRWALAAPFKFAHTCSDSWRDGLFLPWWVLFVLFVGHWAFLMDSILCIVHISCAAKGIALNWRRATQPLPGRRRRLDRVRAVVPLDLSVPCLYAKLFPLICMTILDHLTITNYYPCVYSTELC